MAITTIDDLVFFDQIGMIDLVGLTDPRAIQEKMDQMPPDIARALEIQVGNSVSGQMNLGAVGTPEFDFLGLDFLGYDPIDAQIQTAIPTSTTVEDTTYEVIPTSSTTIPVAAAVLPAPCGCQGTRTLAGAVIQYKRAVLLVVILVGAFLIGKSL